MQIMSGFNLMFQKSEPCLNRFVFHIFKTIELIIFFYVFSFDELQKLYPEYDLSSIKCSALCLKSLRYWTKFCLKLLLKNKINLIPSTSNDMFFYYSLKAVWYIDNSTRSLSVLNLSLIISNETKESFNLFYSCWFNGFSVWVYQMITQLIISVVNDNMCRFRGKW